MKSDKFDNIDRKRVIRTLEQRYATKLSRVGRRQKWLQDQDGRNYWVLGGYGEWHGIPEDMMEAEIGSSAEGRLVVVARRKVSMDIFVGGLDPLIQGRNDLYRAGKSTGDYQFTYRAKGSHLLIDQVPAMSLQKLERIDYEDVEKDKDRTKEELRRMLDGLTEEEKAELVKSLSKKEL